MLSKTNNVQSPSLYRETKKPLKEEVRLAPTRAQKEDEKNFENDVCHPYFEDAVQQLQTKAKGQYVCLHHTFENQFLRSKFYPEDTGEAPDYVTMGSKDDPPQGVNVQSIIEITNPENTKNGMFASLDIAQAKGVS